MFSWIWIRSYLVNFAFLSKVICSFFAFILQCFIFYFVSSRFVVFEFFRNSIFMVHLVGFCANWYTAFAMEFMDFFIRWLNGFLYWVSDGSLNWRIWNWIFGIFWTEFSYSLLSLYCEVTIDRIIIYLLLSVWSSF